MNKTIRLSVIFDFLCLSDDCVTTLPFQPATTFACPDKCPHAGKHFTGNLADPNNPHQYVGCYQGQTVGCIACPKGLLYNQDWDACLYEGKFKTEKSKPKKHSILFILY